MCLTRPKPERRVYGAATSHPHHGYKHEKGGHHRSYEQ